MSKVLRKMCKKKKKELLESKKLAGLWKPVKLWYVLKQTAGN